MITNYARCTRGIQSRIAMTEAAFSKTKTSFTGKLDVNLRKQLLMFYIWSLALRVYGAENWALRRVDQKYLKSVKMWCWRKTEKIS
jgi:hypothetical protein